MSIRQFVRQLGNDRAEGDIIKNIFVSLISSLAVFGLFYFTSFNDIPDFMSKFGFFIFFVILSYAVILPAVKYARGCNELPCMSGMMVGMTIGMIAGFLPGFLIGATNGMFYGSVFGMSIGIFLGIWNGSSCGIMGVMEGMMAGFMGGLMGAMSSVMMLSDHLNIITIIVFVISTVILLGLKYMLYVEATKMEKNVARGDDTYFTMFWSVLLTFVTLMLMVFGPRSFIF